MRILIRMPANRLSRIRLLLSLAGNLLFLIGILTLGYWVYISVDAEVYQAHKAQLFQQARAKLNASVGGGTDNGESLLPRLMDKDRLVGESSGEETPTALPIGKIEIPRIGLSAIILEGTDGLTLRHGVGHILGTSLPGRPGNVALAGHRDTFFRNLRYVRDHDQIVLTTLRGSFHYSVDSFEIVGPQNTSVLEASKNRILTLVTCYPFHYIGPAPRRFVVQAHFIAGNGPQQSRSSASPNSKFEPESRPRE